MALLVQCYNLRRVLAILVIDAFIAISRRRRGAEQPAVFVGLAPEVDVQTQRRQSTGGCLELIPPDGLRLRIEPAEEIEPRVVLERSL
jgi:hypothetical protein